MPFMACLLRSIRAEVTIRANTFVRRSTDWKRLTNRFRTPLPGSATSPGRISPGDESEDSLDFRGHHPARIDLRPCDHWNACRPRAVQLQRLPQHREYRTSRLGHREHLHGDRSQHPRRGLTATALTRLDRDGWDARSLGQPLPVHQPFSYSEGTVAQRSI